MKNLMRLMGLISLMSLVWIAFGNTVAFSALPTPTVVGATLTPVTPPPSSTPTPLGGASATPTSNKPTPTVVVHTPTLPPPTATATPTSTGTSTSTATLTRTATSTPTIGGATATPTNTSTATSTPLSGGTIIVCKVAVVGGVPGNGVGWTMNIQSTNVTPAVSQTGVTDSGGCVTFGNLPVGTYVVSETTQPGWTVEIGPNTSVAVTAGSNVTVTFKNVWPGGSTATFTPTSIASSTPTATATNTLTPTATNTTAATPTQTPTSTGTLTPSSTPTPLGGASATPTVTLTPQSGGPGAIQVCKYAWTVVGVSGFWASGWEMSVQLVASNPPPALLGLTQGDGCITFSNLAPGTYLVSEFQRPGWRNLGGVNQVVTIASGETAVVVFQNEELPIATATPTPPSQFKIYLPFVAKSQGPTPAPICSTRKLKIDYAGLSSTKDFGTWPGPAYGNVLLSYGTPINFSLADGKPAEMSYLSFSDGYLVTGGGPNWQFVAPNANGGHPIPGRQYWWSVWYSDQGTKCTLTILLQWDPPGKAPRK